MVLNGKFYKRKPVGKPRIRWGDVVRRDTAQILGIRKWRSRRPEGGEEWREANAIDGMEFPTRSHVFHQFLLFMRPLHEVHKRNAQWGYNIHSSVFLAVEVPERWSVEFLIRWSP
jgi:hypothetical protein